MVEILAKYCRKHARPFEDYRWTFGSHDLVVGKKADNNRIVEAVVGVETSTLGKVQLELGWTAAKELGVFAHGFVHRGKHLVVGLVVTARKLCNQLRAIR